MTDNRPIGRDAEQRWWESRTVAILLVLLCALPLLWPEVPPLTDLPGHMGRYRVQLDLDSSPALQRFFSFDWALIGNLGVDLLVEVLAPILGLEAAVKLIVLAIPALTAAGFLWVGFEAHGRLPPTALFALPLVYNFPFHFGFVNFALSMALAFLAFGLWLRLGRTERLRLRAALFVPIGLAIWLAHVFGWATLVVMVGAAELVRLRDGGRSWPAALFQTGLRGLALAPPILAMLAWRSGEVGGGTGDWFAWRIKLGWLEMVLRDRWMGFDLAGLAVLLGLVLFALRSASLRFSRPLAAAALALAAIFLLLPRILLGSAYADMRLAPYMLAAAVLAIDLAPSVGVRAARWVALAGLAFVLVRTGGTAASLFLYDRDYRRELAAIDHLPNGARVVALVGRPCGDRWRKVRLEHLPSMAIVRRQAFANDQWQMPGAQLIRVNHPEAGAFASDPSQIVVPSGCRRPDWRPIGEALAAIPRSAFDYVWLIRPPAHAPADVAGLDPLWRSGTSVLYRIAPEEEGAASARGGESAR